MKKQTKSLLAAGVTLAILGLVIMLIGLALNGWSWFGDYDMHAYTATNDYDAIKIEMNAGEVKTEFYNGEKIEVDYPDGYGYKVSFETRGATLEIKCKLKWYMSFINFGFDLPTTVVRLPKNTEYDIDIDITAGTLNLADGAYGKMNIDMSAGTLNGNSVICTSFDSEVSAGTVKFESLDCGYVDCGMSAGTVVINRTTAETVKIDMSAGSAKIGIVGNEEEFTITKKISAGSCNVSERKGTTDKTIDIDLSAGSVVIKFTQ